MAMFAAERKNVNTDHTTAARRQLPPGKSPTKIFPTEAPHSTAPQEINTKLTPDLWHHRLRRDSASGCHSRKHRPPLTDNPDRTQPVLLLLIASGLAPGLGVPAYIGASPPSRRDAGRIGSGSGGGAFLAPPARLRPGPPACAAGRSAGALDQAQMATRRACAHTLHSSTCGRKWQSLRTEIEVQD